MKPTGASIGDFVWYDLDLDGIQDADEPGIPGVEVTLTYPDGTTETLITNSSGEYLFSNLEAGEYTVTVGEGPTDLTIMTVGSYDINLGENEDVTTADFGFGPLGSIVTAGISGSIFQDDNGNGTQDAGEGGIANVPVNLLDTNGNIIAETTTDNNGNYIFNDVFQNDYVVAVGDGPENWIITTPPTQDASVDVGEYVTDIDFGFQPDVVEPTGNGSIGEIVFEDTNLSLIHI